MFARDVKRWRVSLEMKARYIPLSEWKCHSLRRYTCKENRCFCTFLCIEYRPLANSGKLIANYSGMDRRSNINYELIHIIKL